MFRSGWSVIVWGWSPGRCCILRDVTDAHRTTQELRHHRQHLEALVAERTRRLTDTNARLLAEIEDRKRAEALLAARARLEGLVNAISADFLALPPSECSPGHQPWRWRGSARRVGVGRRLPVPLA